METIQKGLNYYIECDIVMLPTEAKKGALSLGGTVGLHDKLDFGINQHLYIVNNERIEPNDWAIDIEDNILFKVKEQGHAGLLRSEDNSYVEDACKKVIATTDSDITSDYSSNGTTFIPDIPQSYIKDFMIKYNSGNDIEKVLVEVVNNGDIDFGSGIEFILKTNVLNEITILIEQKQIFSKKDVIELFFQYQHDLSQWVLNMENDIFEKPMPIDWIKRKLN
jgi:hypothetical protein